MTAGQNFHRGMLWLVISAMSLRQAFRDSISDGWMAALSILFLIIVIVLAVAQGVVDRNAKRSMQQQ
jgi:hypothetical protein